MKSINSIREKIGELYHFRFMFYSLVKKSLFGKYKNSTLGFLWNFLTPAISILLFYIVFENFMGRGIPYYWAYLCVGMFPFSFMNTNLIGGASNITSNGGMIKKMYFPRELLPLSQVAYTLIVFLIAYVIVFIMMLITGFPLSTKGMLALPLVIITMFIFSFGTILLTSAISVYSRDFEYLITAFARVLFWVTPIFYMVDSLTGVLSKIIWFNPLTYYIVGLQDIIYKGLMPSAELLIVCTVLSTVTLIVGLYIFEKLKDGFAEKI
ncbi:MAG: lipopolysaccharide transport system permease protein [Candidatus Methanomethylophilaceae archaeon]|nr:lipopolysaccharide transport system permease protein [Candidatus Methanomethylophilaceae archaeon]